MSFEKFTPQRIRPSHEAMITILRGGQLGINKVCTEKYLKQYKYAVLFFDKEHNKIGVQPTNDATRDDVHSIRFLKKNCTLANISAVEFLDHYKIQYKKESIAYPATWNEKEKLIEISLNHPKIKEG